MRYEKDNLPSNTEIADLISRRDYRGQIKQRVRKTSGRASLARAWVIEHGDSDAQGELTAVGTQIQEYFPRFCRKYLGFEVNNAIHEIKRKEIAYALHLCMQDIISERKRNQSEATEKDVYIVGNTEHGVCKIGKSSRLEKRLYDISSGFPWELYLLALFEGGGDFESELHERFSDQNTTGEWFEINSSIKELFNLDPVPVKDFS
jgi:hypothetical protein